MNIYYGHTCKLKETNNTREMYGVYKKTMDSEFDVKLNRLNRVVSIPIIIV